MDKRNWIRCTDKQFEEYVQEMVKDESYLWGALIWMPRLSTLAYFYLSQKLSRKQLRHLRIPKYVCMLCKDLK